MYQYYRKDQMIKQNSLIDGHNWKKKYYIKTVYHFYIQALIIHFPSK